MGIRLIDLTAPNAISSWPGAAGADTWIIEVLLDTIAAALQIPLRLVIRPRIRMACFPGESLGKTIERGFGDLATFHLKLRDVTADPCEGLREIYSNPIWGEVAKEVRSLRAVVTSNSDPFWTVMRGLIIFDTWNLLWLIDGTSENDAADPHMPAPFGEDFTVCKSVTPKLDFRIAAGPVWNWMSGTCGEPAVTPSGTGTVARIREAFASYIDRHLDDVRQRKAVGIFSEERLARSVMSRPPMLLADLRRRVRLASRSLEHALCMEAPSLPQAAELVSVAISALHLAEREDSVPERFAPGSEIWHRLESGCDQHLNEPTWLVTKIVSQGKDPGVALAELHSGSPPPSLASRRIFAATPSSEDQDDMALSRLMVDYATGRSGYIRERMMVVRLWTRDNFARWLTKPNLPREKEYSDSVDSLASRIADVFVADRCSIFRYDAEESTLDRLGRFAKDQTKDLAARAKSYSEIREVGFDREKRRVSPRYRAIDEARPISMTKFRDELNRLGGAREGSRLVVPLVVFGRPWGAVELVGLRPYQFLPSAILWLDEFCKLLGHDLYHEDILNALHQISSCVLTKKGKEEQFRDVIQKLARIFVAGSGALYLQHPRRTAEFVCVAFFGRPPDQRNGMLSGFNIEDRISKSALILRGEKTDWFAGTIGSGEFDGEWAVRPKTLALKREGYKFIAMMPVPDGNDRVIGCITLAAREGKPFEDRFQYLAEFATRYAGVAIEAIKLKHQPDESMRELMAHSLKTRVDRVAGAAETLEQLLASFFGEAGDAGRVGYLLRDIEREAARSRWDIAGSDRSGRRLLSALQKAFDPLGQSSFPIILEDLRTHNSDLRRTAAYLAGNVANDENPWETTESRWSGTPTALRDCLLGCVLPVARSRGVEVATPPPHELGSEIRVRVSPLVMSEIINNFYDNARKYSVSGTGTSIRFRWMKGSPAYLDFRNLAPKLTDDEIDRLFTPGFRSTYARGRSYDGQGLGLASNRHLSERWNMKVLHRQAPMEKESAETVWQVFSLEIPSDMVFEVPERLRRI